MAVKRVTVARRFTDTTIAGHVDNTVFLDYWQEARVAFFAEYGSWGRPDWMPVVARHEIDFRGEILWSTEPLQVDLWVASIGTTSYTMVGRILDERGNECALVRSVIVGIDPQTRKATPFPSDLRAALEAILVEEDL